MKKNKILILALSVGLVFSGTSYTQSYAADNSNANASIATSEVKEYQINISIPGQITKGETINATPEEIEEKVLELAKSYQEEFPFEYSIIHASWLGDVYDIQFLKNKPLTTAPDDELSPIKKEYATKLDKLFYINSLDKEAAKESIYKANSEQEIINAYNAAYSKNQDNLYKQEQEQIQKDFENYKKTAKETIDRNPNKLSAEELQAYKDRIDKAPTKGAINMIMDEFGLTKPDPLATRDYDIFIEIPNKITKGEIITAAPDDIEAKVAELAERYKKEVNLDYEIIPMPWIGDAYTIEFKKTIAKEKTWKVIVQHPDGTSTNKTISALPGKENEKVEELAKAYNLPYTIVFDEVSQVYIIRLRPAKDTEIAEYRTIRRPNKSMYIGEEKVVQEGKNGLWSIENGVRKLTKSPVDEIIEYGTKEKPQTTKVAEYQTRRIANKDMYVGTEKVIQKGKNGEWTLIKGKWTLTTAPIDEIIEYGTRLSPTVETRVINYKTYYRPNPNKFPYKPELVQKGQNGYQQKDKFGNWVTVVKPIPEIYEYGTKSAITPYPVVVYNKDIVTTPLLTYTPSTAIISTPTLKDRSKVTVDKGYTYVPAGTYNRDALEKLRKTIITAYEKNKQMADAAQWLIDNTPQTVAKVRSKLDKQLVESKKLQDQAQSYIKELDKILGLSYNAIY